MSPASPRAPFPGRAPVGAHPLWTSLLDSLRDTIPAPHVDDLERCGTVLDVTRSSFILGGPPEMLRRWLGDGRLRLIAHSLGDLTDHAHDLILLPLTDAPVSRWGAGLTVESFIASPANQEIVDLSVSVIQHPGSLPSPLLIRGPAGSGKTHLLCGLAHGLAAREDRRPLRHLRAEELSLALVSALREHALPAFRKDLQSCSALLVDDIDQLAGRAATQDELARTLEILLPSGIQVVFTTSRPMEDLPDLAPRLHAQLQEGTRIELHPPEWETCLAIVLERLSRWQLPVSPEAATMIVSRLGSNLRDLDALLTRVLTHPLFPGHLSDAPTLRRILAQGDRLRRGQASPESVLGTILRHFNLRLADLRSPARSPRVAGPRQIAMYLLRQQSGLSYPEIGQRLRRHHTTALHACRRMEGERIHNPALHATLCLLEKEVHRMRGSTG